MTPTSTVPTEDTHPSRTALPIPESQTVSTWTPGTHSSHGHLALNNRQIAAWEREYDDRNLTVMEQYFGTENEPIYSPDGYHRIEREYDGQKLVAVERYFGNDGEPILGKGGYHEIRRTWQDSRHATSEAWFDTARQPMPLKDTYCRVERKFDENGNTQQ